MNLSRSLARRGLYVDITRAHEGVIGRDKRYFDKPSNPSPCIAIGLVVRGKTQDVHGMGFFIDPKDEAPLRPAIAERRRTTDA